MVSEIWYQVEDNIELGLHLDRFLLFHAIKHALRN